MSRRERRQRQTKRVPLISRERVAKRADYHSVLMSARFAIWADAPFILLGLEPAFFADLIARDIVRSLGIAIRQRQEELAEQERIFVPS